MGLFARLFGKKEAVATAARSLRYRTGINETPRSVARKFYGDESKWELVWRTNQRVLRDEVQGRDDAILPGTELEIPEPAFDLEGKPMPSPET